MGFPPTFFVSEMEMTVDSRALESICEPALAALGYDLVALEFKREQQGWVLRLFIEQQGETGKVSLEDCARASRDVSVALDVADLIHHPYSLELSSPGLERPLAKERDFARFEGKRAHIRTREPIDGRRNYSGTLRGVADGRILIDCDGQRHELPLERVAKAHLQFEPTTLAKE